MLENSLHASVDVISREIRFMSVNPGFVEFDGSFQVMLFHIPKLISGVDISSKSAEVVYGFDPDKPEESYRYVMDLYALDGDYCTFRWVIPFTFFAKKRWAFFQVRIRTTSGTAVESQWSTKLKKVYVTPGLTGGQEAYTQAQQDAIAALNSRVTALEASGGGSGSIQLQVDQTPTENSQNLVTSGGVYKAIQEIEPSGSSEDSRIPTPTVSDNGKVLGVVNGVYALKTDETGSGGSGEDARIPTPTASDNGKVLGVVNGVYALKTDETGSGGGSSVVEWTALSPSEFSVSESVWEIGIDYIEAFYCQALGVVRFSFRTRYLNQLSSGIKNLKFKIEGTYRPALSTAAMNGGTNARVRKTMPVGVINAHALNGDCLSACTYVALSTSSSNPTDQSCIEVFDLSGNGFDNVNDNISFSGFYYLEAPSTT